MWNYRTRCNISVWEKGVIFPFIFLFNSSSQRNSNNPIWGKAVSPPLTPLMQMFISSINTIIGTTKKTLKRAPSNQISGIHNTDYTFPLHWPLNSLITDDQVMFFQTPCAACCFHIQKICCALFHLDSIFLPSCLIQQHSSGFKCNFLRMYSVWTSLLHMSLEDNPWSSCVHSHSPEFQL